MMRPRPHGRTIALTFIAIDNERPHFTRRKLTTNPPLSTTANLCNSPTMSEQTYNGWANYETWNVSLWLQNDEAMYQLALEHVNMLKRWNKPVKYDLLIPSLELRFSQITPDGVRWMDGRINTDELDSMLSELS